MPLIITRNPILITGGAGFIGSNLVRKLLSLGCNVHLTIKKNTDLNKIKDIRSKIKIHEVDLLEKNKLQKKIHEINPSVIFHLATYSEYRNQNKIKSMTDANIMGTINLLLASRDIDYKIFVNTGSSSEYGFKSKPIKENDVLEPISFYAATKASSTLLCKVFAKTYKKPIVTFRLFSVYGPYEEKTRLVPTLIRSIIHNKTIKLTTGNKRRDFIYVDDVINAYLKSIKMGNKLMGKILNIGTNQQYTNDEIALILFKLTGITVPVNKGAFPKRIWDTDNWIADISFAKKLLDWQPKHSIEKGLEKTYLWFKDND